MRAILIVLALAGLLLAGCQKDEATKRSAATHAAVRGAEARAKPFVASVLREPFHKGSCKWAGKIAEPNLVGYDSRKDAIADGHRPCKVCRP